jgi:hypothetical protein
MGCQNITGIWLTNVHVAIYIGQLAEITITLSQEIQVNNEINGVIFATFGKIIDWYPFLEE